MTQNSFSPIPCKEVLRIRTRKLSRLPDPYPLIICLDLALQIQPSTSQKIIKLISTVLWLLNNLIFDGWWIFTVPTESNKQKKTWKPVRYSLLLAAWKPLKKKAGSRSVSKRYQYGSRTLMEGRGGGIFILFMSQISCGPGKILREKYRYRNSFF
jgi:hypothetical protein